MTEPRNYFKSYDLLYRGLPAEIRLLIWDYAIPKIIPFYMKIAFLPALRPSHKASTYLSLILVSKEVREEVFAVTDRTIIFDMHNLQLRNVQSAWEHLDPSIIRMIKAVQIPLYDNTIPSAHYPAGTNSSVARAATLSHVSELHVYINGNTWLNNAVLAYQQRSGGRPMINATGFVSGYGCKIQDQSNKVQRDLFNVSAPTFHGASSTRVWPFHLLWDLFGAVAQGHVSKIRIHGDHLNRVQCALLQEDFESFLKIYHSRHLKKHLVHMTISFPSQESMLKGSCNEGEMVMQRM